MNKEKITKSIISIWFESLLFVSFKVNKIKDHDIKTSKELRILSLCPCVIVRETEREGERRRETGRQAERKKGQGDRGTGRQKGKNKERRTI